MSSCKQDTGRTAKGTPCLVFSVTYVEKASVAMETQQCFRFFCSVCAVCVCVCVCVCVRERERERDSKNVTAIFLLPLTVRRTNIFVYSVRYFYRVLTKFGISRSILRKMYICQFPLNPVQWGSGWFRRTEMANFATKFAGTSSGFL